MGCFPSVESCPVATTATDQLCASLLAPAPPFAIEYRPDHESDMTPQEVDLERAHDSYAHWKYQHDHPALVVFDDLRNDHTRALACWLSRDVTDYVLRPYVAPPMLMAVGEKGSVAVYDTHDWRCVRHHPDNLVDWFSVPMRDGVLLYDRSLKGPLYHRAREDPRERNGISEMSLPKLYNASSARHNSFSIVVGGTTALVDPRSLYPFGAVSAAARSYGDCLGECYPLFILREDSNDRYWRIARDRAGALIDVHQPPVAAVQTHHFVVCGRRYNATLPTAIAFSDAHRSQLYDAHAARWTSLPSCHNAIWHRRSCCGRGNTLIVCGLTSGHERRVDIYDMRTDDLSSSHERSPLFAGCFAWRDDHIVLCATAAQGVWAVDMRAQHRSQPLIDRFDDYLGDRLQTITELM